jgi:TRAP-type uncharacterized transport system substrate-binding protein
LLVAASGLSLLLLVFYALPTPPSKVIIATSFKGGAYELYAQRYREILAASRIRVEIRNTDGSGENLRLLDDPKSGVQIAFLQGGFSNKTQSPRLLSLGRISYQPFWVFYRSPDVWTDLTNLKGKRIAMGPVGGGTRAIARKVLEAIGEPVESDRFEPLFGRPAATALREGRVDAIILPGTTESPLIQDLFRDKSLRLLNVPRAEALTRRIPILAPVVIPAGMIDFEKNVPEHDFTILGTTTALVVTEDLHPGIVRQLAAALKEVHSGAGSLQKAGEFPSQNDPEYTFSETAREYYRIGPALLDRYLPFWMTTYAQRLLAALVALFAIVLPSLNYLPRLYRWMTRERTLRLYRRLRELDRKLHGELTLTELAELQTTLEEIDRSATQTKIPLRHTDHMFSLKVHMNLVRQRLTARVAELSNCQRRGPPAPLIPG